MGGRPRPPIGVGWLLVSFWLVVVLGGSAAAAKKTVSGVININEAPAAVLVLLPGVGPAKAERIVAYRQRHRFATVEELGRVKGIGPKTVRKLRLFLTVRGPTTAQAPGTVSAAVPPIGAASVAATVAPSVAPMAGPTGPVAIAPSGAGTPTPRAAPAPGSMPTPRALPSAPTPAAGVPAASDKAPPIRIKPPARATALPGHMVPATAASREARAGDRMR
ncbi:MAG TPA: helix-hairpin-helix domain-containing protein [Polyangia bacterium]